MEYPTGRGAGVLQLREKRLLCFLPSQDGAMRFSHIPNELAERCLNRNSCEAGVGEGKRKVQSDLRKLRSLTSRMRELPDA